jgi:hypothetical protein
MINLAKQRSGLLQAKETKNEEHHHHEANNVKRLANFPPIVVCLSFTGATTHSVTSCDFAAS